MAGCALAYNLAGVNTLCVSIREPMRRANVDGAVAAVRAAKRAGVPRLIHTSSAATIGEAPGLGRQRVDRAPRLVPVDLRADKTEGERAAMAAAREAGQDVIYVNPSSVQGPGRASGTGRFLLGGTRRPAAGVRQHRREPRRHRRLRRGPPAGRRARRSRRALPAQRDPPDRLRRAGAGRRRGRREVQPSHRPARARDHRGNGAWSRRSGCAAASHRCAARWCARFCTATSTTAPGPSASWGCTTPTRARPSGARSSGPAPRDLLRNV